MVWSWRTRAIRVLAWAAVGWMTLTLVARAISGTSWAVDMVATLAAQWAVASAAAGIASVLLRARVAGAILLVVALLHALWLQGGRADRADRTGETISVLTMNAYAENETPELVARVLEGSGADVAVVLEAETRIVQAIRASAVLTERYPWRVMPKRGKRWGVVVLSRWPVRELDLQAEHPERRREMKFNYTFVRTALVERPEGPFLLTAMWPDSPRTPARWAEGNGELRQDAEVVRQYLAPRGYPIVAFVDLNATPSGYRTGLIEREAGLRRAKPLRVARGTWPSSLPGFLRVAIDDVLVSGSIGVVSWTTIERETGSDHVPVIVELVIPGAGAGGEEAR